jgi:O-antigen ligase
MVATTAIAGTMFMRSSVIGKLVCSVSIIFSLNTIVLCRSRGAVLALAGAYISFMITSPKRLRMKLIAGMVIALVGLFYVSDDQFLTRIAAITEHTEAVISGGEAEDVSAMMRIQAWRGGLQMFIDHPFGVGPGNFNQFIGRYAPDVQGLSPHSTYIQAMAELGLTGILLILILIGNAWWTARKVIVEANYLPEPDKSTLQWHACGLSAVVVGYAACGLTGHHIFFEGFWWFLLMPVCLKRASDYSHDQMSVNTANSAKDESGPKLAV